MNEQAPTTTPGTEPKQAAANPPTIEKTSASDPGAGISTTETAAVSTETQSATEKTLNPENIPETEGSPETPDNEADLTPVGKLKSIADRFRSTADAFIRKYIKGEVEPEPVPLTKTEVAKTAGIKLIGAAFSLGGIKSLADVPIWLLQK